MLLRTENEAEQDQMDRLCRSRSRRFLYVHCFHSELQWMRRCS
jgi:Tat protein secretion system quality control protein TatD with DNase activity